MIDETKCYWYADQDLNWNSTCGECWCFEDGGPKANRMNFCPFCGKPLVEEPARYDEWGDLIEPEEDEA